ncbi:class I adenylate-forming enzyme family protein [Streptosporangium sp. NPDC000396]|uniref:class I adenylate-forming enzyme family protein n=1 Tax=Streptosporangium sp. NPDC000396 TaxID=3366185 RepID=UPI0036B7AB22
MNPTELLLSEHIDSGSGDTIALVERDQEIGYAGLREAAARYAGMLAEARVRPGSRALVVSDDSIAAVIAVLGLWWHGCVPVPVNPMLRDAEIAFVAKDSAAEFVHLNVSPERKKALRAELGAIPCFEDDAPARTPDEPFVFQDDDEVLVQYTSGSTGRPRGVRHGLSGVKAVLNGFGQVLKLTPDDIVLSTAKLSFGYGFGNSLLFPLAAGARSVLLPGPVDPFAVAAALHRHRPTVLCSVPRVYASLLDLKSRDSKVDVASVRLAVSAGEHLPVDLAKRLAQTFGFPLVNGLGATEVLHIVMATAPDDAPKGSTGLPVPGVQVSVRDERGKLLPDGFKGRLHVSTASAALGYIDRPDAATRTFADGGVYTGDLVYSDGDGEIRHVCRADDVLNLGGFKVAPLEIESVLRDVPGVADCAVVADRDQAGLEQAVAHVVAEHGAEHDAVRRAIRAAFKERLTPYKRPSRIEIHEVLPTTSTGKLARFRLREPGAPS